MVSYDFIERIKKGALDLIVLSDSLERSYRDSEYETVLDLTEKSLQKTSFVYMMARGLFLRLYESFPSVPQQLPQMEAENFNVSFEKLKEFSFPVYKMSMPFLLPNKRKRNIDRNNAITNAVISAVREYKQNNKLNPFKHATVFFVSSNKNINYLIDNDNKEASIILNGLICKLLVDDRPTTCNTAYYTKIVEDPNEVKTEVFVVDADHDVEVLSMIKNNLACHIQV